MRPGGVTLPEHRPKTGSPLDSYLKAARISRRAFSRISGFTYRTVDLLCTGRIIPNLITIALVERITKGVVPMEAWLGIDLARAELSRRLRRVKDGGPKETPTEIVGPGLAPFGRSLVAAVPEEPRLGSLWKQSVDVHERPLGDGGRRAKKAAE